MSRGFFAVGIYGPKNIVNIGTLWRSANLFGASYIYTIGARYKAQASDTMNTPKHVPLFEYDTFDAFKAALPRDCMITAVELDETAEPIKGFKHPERTAYLLGAEDQGIPQAVLKKCHRVVKLPGERSMNVSAAGSIVLFDRSQK